MASRIRAFSAVSAGSMSFPNIQVLPQEVETRGEDMDGQKSSWSALWFGNGVQLVLGLQLSMYFTSMWPYLSKLDPSASLSFFGVVLASFSFGQAIASPVFGTWSQKTESFKPPIATGLVLCSCGHLLYGLLPTIGWQPKWLMLAARIIVGVGSGNLSVLRSFTSAASTLADRNKAVATSIAGYVSGMIIGPVIQAGFGLMGSNRLYIGRLEVDSYTLPAFLMTLVNVVFAVLTFYFFTDSYVGIIDEEEKGEGNEKIVVPPFDRIAAFICIYLWFVTQTIGVNIESLCSPFTIAIYSWTNNQAIVYNGIIQTASCVLSVSQYLTVAFTRVGKIDRRKQIVFGITVFAIYYLISLPWPFYTTRLTYNSTATDGACTFPWCQNARRVPFVAYVIAYIVGFGMAFPYIGNSVGTLFSEVLGPRQQGIMQGVFAFVGSIGRCVAPIITTTLFSHTGYIWISVETLVLLAIGAIMTIVFWRRLVPLEVRIEKNSTTVSTVS
ncbi:unnamed protein product [Caenorhabditis auriculariae]|uniref:Major facilitator superfamily (MFS) profile domain-containing protein n=1 Tax=Caenorhabditis auriculariae TaxID=2777116 RepID=A0A8S1HHG3_9PELO|nr:unnamed protein product [Caenorhabditis auriculariae]